MRKETLPSIRSFFRASRTRHRSRQGGFALLVALVLAVLYFAFIELLMIDASRELAEARRFRARILALTLAENGAELAAVNIVARKAGERWSDDEDDWQGTTRGEMARDAGNAFVIEARAHSKGPEGTDAAVRLEGSVIGGDVQINFARHSQ